MGNETIMETGEISTVHGQGCLELNISGRQ